MPTIEERVIRLTPVTEAAHAVLIRALWRAAAHELGEQLDDLVYRADSREEAAEVDRRIAGFLAIRLAIDTIEDEGIGVACEIPITVEELTHELQGIASAIEEDEHFWDEPARRARLLAEHDEAQELCRQLGETVA